MHHISKMPVEDLYKYLIERITQYNEDLRCELNPTYSSSIDSCRNELLTICEKFFRADRNKLINLRKVYTNHAIRNQETIEAGTQY